MNEYSYKTTGNFENLMKFAAFKTKSFQKTKSNLQITQLLVV